MWVFIREALKPERESVVYEEVGAHSKPLLDPPARTPLFSFSHSRVQPMHVPRVGEV